MCALMNQRIVSRTQIGMGLRQMVILVKQTLQLLLEDREARLGLRDSVMLAHVGNIVGRFNSGQ